MKITTDSGFSCEFDERVLNDFRTVAAMGEMMDEELSDTQRMAAATRVVNRIIGKEKARLFAHVEKDGFVAQEDVFAELNNILEKAAEASKEVKKG